MEAGQIAAALGAYRPPYQTSQGPTWKVRCPAHPDKNPSMNITASISGRTLVKCWAGCTQAELIEALIQRGLWDSTESRTPRPLPFRWEDALSVIPPTIPTGPDREFERKYTQAYAWGQLAAMTDEIVDLYGKAEAELTLKSLRHELRLACSCSRDSISAAEIESCLRRGQAARERPTRHVMWLEPSVPELQP